MHAKNYVDKKPRLKVTGALPITHFTKPAKSDKIPSLDSKKNRQEEEYSRANGRARVKTKIRVYVSRRAK